MVDHVCKLNLPFSISWLFKSTCLRLNYLFLVCGLSPYVLCQVLSVVRFPLWFSYRYRKAIYIYIKAPVGPDFFSCRSSPKIKNAKSGKKIFPAWMLQGWGSGKQMLEPGKQD